MVFSERDLYFMREALREAEAAARKGEVPVGAILVSEEGDILARAHNQPISLCDPTAHAEILALREGAKRLGNYRLLGTTLYVTLEPCPMCAGALVYARVKRLVFGARDAKSGACGTIYNIVNDERLNHRLEVISGLLAEEAARLLRDFFKIRR
ncbi:tRNA adenosine(34) deaminase TadA [Thermosulfurimonas dismutans]|uniref:tRNA-specific adenosine deaminase n=1 Tax=Thermosulfurimonas dismutans TaxID=999894 RepID=A0A179D7E5_9BACT|nr:tRNA adenosine(34) deaminase TadA [Thermosulfurimonas dismutans]OAQ21372.1 tRNA-specific adenosine-34 deaminase [Thermosulfurimonas dismutans]